MITASSGLGAQFNPPDQKTARRKKMAGSDQWKRVASNRICIQTKTETPDFAEQMRVVASPFAAQHDEKQSG
jgi:hypothetical protein